MCKLSDQAKENILIWGMPGVALVLPLLLSLLLFLLDLPEKPQRWVPDLAAVSALSGALLGGWAVLLGGKINRRHQERLRTEELKEKQNEQARQRGGQRKKLKKIINVEIYRAARLALAVANSPEEAETYLQPEINIGAQFGATLLVLSINELAALTRLQKRFNESRQDMHWSSNMLKQACDNSRNATYQEEELKAHQGTMFEAVRRDCFALLKVFEVFYPQATMKINGEPQLIVKLLQQIAPNPPSSASLPDTSAPSANPPAHSSHPPASHT